MSETPKISSRTVGPIVPARAPEETRPARMDELASLPVFFKLKGQRVILAGGSDPALWKAELLSAAGAQLEIFAQNPIAEFAQLIAQPPGGEIHLHRRPWCVDDFAHAVLAIGALDDDAEAQAFVCAAKAAGVPVNVIDRPAFCAFQFGAIVNRSPLVVAISTDGAAPVFAQAIRSRFEALLPQGFKHWAQAAKTWRRQGNRLGLTLAGRRRFWERFTERALAQADRAPTDNDLEELIADGGSALQNQQSYGHVTLAGAGPGDPELLTLKAVRALRGADVILYDDLVTAPVLEFSRRESKRVLVGKTGYGPACKQTEINALMVAYAREGKRVVRLKSGDPMIFGRAGEEIAELRAAGIAFDVIPGISTVQAAAARLQVSLTHRDLARRVQLVTGHSREGKLPDDLDWRALADPNATTAVYMANRTFAELSRRLIGEGLDAATPAVALIDVTRSSEEIIASTIGELPAKLAARQSSGRPSGPCLIVIGAVLQDAWPMAASGASGALLASKGA